MLRYEGEEEFEIYFIAIFYVPPRRLSHVFFDDGLP